MLCCTFFGHKDCPEYVRPVLLAVLEDLIVTHKVDVFYVGHQGSFDACVRGVLRQLEDQYPHICYAVVLSRLPGRLREDMDYSDIRFRRESRRSIRNTQLPGATIGCFKDRIMWSPILTIIGVGLHSLRKKP